MEAYLHAHIPLSADMGVRVIESGPERVRIEVPLEPNLNHRRTAFGGSVSAVAILAGWTLVHERLRREGLTCRTVIQDSSIRFDAPIHGAFRATCEAVADGAWDRFKRTLTRRGKGRVEVSGQVEAGGHAVATFRGVYVALAAE